MDVLQDMIQEKFTKAFSNTETLDMLKQAVGVDDIQIITTPNGLKLSFTVESGDKLDSLLLRPKQRQVAPRQRRTKTGVFNVAGYTQTVPSPTVKELIQALDQDSQGKKKVDEALTTWVEKCLEKL